MYTYKQQAGAVDWLTGYDLYSNRWRLDKSDILQSYKFVACVTVAVATASSSKDATAARLALHLGIYHVHYTILRHFKYTHRHTLNKYNPD